MTTKVPFPQDFKPQQLHLTYNVGKWNLTGHNGDLQQALWENDSSSGEFIGELNDDRGTHLFSFTVNGAAATIKAISTGYPLRILATGATISVNHGQELGFIESSAFGLGESNYTNPDYCGIYIDCADYNGSRGLLSTPRDSSWVKAPTINTFYAGCGQGRKLWGHHAYTFYEPDKGHGFEAHKDVLLWGDLINLNYTAILAGQDIEVGRLCALNDAAAIHSYIRTQGVYMHAGDGLYFLFSGAWQPHILMAFAGDIQDPSFEVAACGIANLDYGRILKYSTGYVDYCNTKEFDLFCRAPHIYGFYSELRSAATKYKNENNTSSKKGYTKISKGGNFSGAGAGSYGKTIGSSAHHTPLSYAQSRMPSFSSLSGNMGSHINITGANFSISNRGGNVTMSGSIDFTSHAGAMRLGTTTIGAGYVNNDGGRRIELSSAYTPVSMIESARLWNHGVNPQAMNPSLALHGGASAAIDRLMNRPERLNMLPFVLALGGGETMVTVGTILLGAAIATKVALDGTEEALDAKDRQKANAAATSGAPDPEEDPEGEKKKKEEKEEEELKPSAKQRLKEAKLPTEGKIRFVPPEHYNPSAPLVRGPNRGFLDKFGNEWVKGPSRTAGETFEWDVQLSKMGKSKLGWASRDGSHVNVSLQGKITHM